jgi:hypothetical protein
MCRKIITSIVILSLVSVGGLFAFSDFQERKLIVAVDHLIQKAELINLDVSYDSLRKNIFSFYPEVKIKKLQIKTKNTEKPSNELNNQISLDFAHKVVIFEELKIKSNLKMKDFTLENIEDIKYSEQENSGIIRDNFRIVFGFSENPIQKKFLSESNLKNLEYISFKDNGYKHFDINKNLLEEFKGNSLVSFKNESNNENYIYNIKINSDQIPVKIREMKDKKEIAIHELSHGKISLDIDVMKTKAFSTNANFHIKNLSFETKESKIEANGKIQPSLVESKIIGDGIVNFKNHTQFLKLLKDINGNNESYLLDFIEKTLPEISEHKAENILSLKYEQNENSILLGSKDFAQLSADYVNYVAGIIKDKAQNFIEGDKDNKKDIE